MKWIRVAGLVVVVVLTVAVLEAAVAAYTPQGTTSLAGDSRVWIDPPSVSAEVGETFTVTVRVDSAQDMVGYEFAMSWNGSVVDVIDVADAGSLLEEPATDLDISEGSLEFGAAVLQEPPYEDGADGDFPLAVITLQVVGTGSSPLDLDGRKVMWTDIELNEHSPDQVDDGNVTVGLDFSVFMPVLVRNYGP